jgi:hypothetical protein
MNKQPYNYKGGDGDEVDIYIGKPSLIDDVIRQSLNNQFDIIANHPNPDYHPGTLHNIPHMSTYYYYWCLLCLMWCLNRISFTSNEFSTSINVSICSW